MTTGDPGLVDVDELYDKMMNVYTWNDIRRDDYDVDYQNYYTFLGVLPQRELFVSTANALLKVGDKERALKVLDRCQESMPENVWPLDAIPLGFSTNDYMVVNMVSAYFAAGAPDKAAELGAKLGKELLASAHFYMEYYEYAQDEFEKSCQFLYFLVDELEKGGDKKVSAELKHSLVTLLRAGAEAYDQDYGNEADSTVAEDTSAK